MARTERWIKLRLHRRHPVIFDLADEMEVPPETALACAIDWFRQLDSDGDPYRTYSATAINGASGSTTGVGFCEAARRIGWLTKDADRFRPSDPTQWFSDPAKKRLARRDDADGVPRLPIGSQTDAKALPPGSGSADQSREESDENLPTEVEGNDPNINHVGSADTAKAERDLAMQRRGYLEIMRMIQDSGVAKNNLGRAVNWAVNVIPSGLLFVRRVWQQAVDQGLHPGQAEFARYLYCCIRDEAKQINQSANKPVDETARTENDDGKM